MFQCFLFLWFEIEMLIQLLPSLTRDRYKEPRRIELMSLFYCRYANWMNLFLNVGSPALLY
uniref:Uncharacterized protein n=1 Tax=Utricularia reniformis TaxID=192314 RepID=A0A1Y0B1V7_9LAMI|nr:hypothetical protein AEK19_MT1223 [Utricularia reniformis]ART31436.1 hypothetical protein AEK19_MT1223 [Utricularia reniformis]